jgi:hypothetical protein
MIDRYIVSTAGRTGSHIVMGCIQHRGLPAVHTHSVWYESDSYATTGLVIVLRRDMFSAIMSTLLVSHTGQTTLYSKTDWPTFEVTRYNFDRVWRHHRWYSLNHKFERGYGQVVEIYYEDFVDDYDHVARSLGIDHRPLVPCLMNPNFTVSAPYSYKDFITNIDQCQSWFQELETQACPEYFDPAPFRFRPWKVFEYIKEPYNFEKGLQPHDISH